jgi:hypothetical protein
LKHKGHDTALVVLKICAADGLARTRMNELYSNTKGIVARYIKVVSARILVCAPIICDFPQCGNMGLAEEIMDRLKK